MASDDLEKKVPDLEAKVAELQRSVNTLKATDDRLYKNDVEAHENLLKLDEKLQGGFQHFAVTGNKQKDATVTALRAIQQQVFGAIFVNLIVFRDVLANQVIDKEVICAALRLKLHDSDLEEQPHFAGVLKAFLGACDKPNHPGDAQETFERAKPHLRVVDENYFRDEED